MISSDYNALFQIKTLTGFTTWTGPDSTACTSWVGVSCASSGQVISLSLLSFGLEGPFPSQFGLLSTAFSHLNLQDNQLTQSIPSQLSSLITLTYLNFGYNSVYGSIPSQLSTLTSLLAMSMASNRLTGTIPSQLSTLKAVTQVAISRNLFDGTIPSQLTTMTNLRTLVSHCEANQSSI
jgi:Leucine-rich repeat (LRR) protein